MSSRFCWSDGHCQGWWPSLIPWCINIGNCIHMFSWNLRTNEFSIAARFIYGNVLLAKSLFVNIRKTLKLWFFIWPNYTVLMSQHTIDVNLSRIVMIMVIFRWQISRFENSIGSVVKVSSHWVWLFVVKIPRGHCRSIMLIKMALINL